MKYTDVKKLPNEERDKKLQDLKIELMKLNAQVAIGTTPKSTKQIREIKRNIARVETLRTQEFHDQLKGMTGTKDKPKSRNYKHH